LILDFSTQDRIGLSSIDANTNVAGDQAFNATILSAFDGAVGRLRFTSSGGTGYLSGDVNGDKTADFTIRLAGVTSLSASSLFL
jgi:hypothetical protein